MRLVRPRSSYIREFHVQFYSKCAVLKISAILQNLNIEVCKILRSSEFRFKEMIECNTGVLWDTCLIHAACPSLTSVSLYTQIWRSCYSNSTERPLSCRRTDRSVVFVSWCQCAHNLIRGSFGPASPHSKPVLWSVQPFFAQPTGVSNTACRWMERASLMH